MYRYIFWDLDETLLDFKKAEAAAISKTLNAFGIKPEKEIVELYSKINLSCWKRYEKGEITRDEIYTSRVILLSEALGVKMEAEKFSKEYFSQLAKQGHTFPYAVTILKTLRKKGYKMAAATNGAAMVQINRIVASGLSGFFSGGIFISEKIGFKKPEPQFFDYMVKALDIKNQNEILVIGDSQTSDIAGATAAGIDSCFVNLKGENLMENSLPTYIANSLEEIIEVCKL